MYRLLFMYKCDRIQKMFIIDNGLSDHNLIYFLEKPNMDVQFLSKTSNTKKGNSKSDTDIKK